MSTAPPLETILGQRNVSVKFTDKRTDTFIVHQFLIPDYPAALKLFADEIGLVALACRKPRAEIEALTPESYEELQAAVQEVNAKGFFVYAARQQKLGQETLSALPADLVQAAFGRFLSASPSQTSPPRRT